MDGKVSFLQLSFVLIMSIALLNHVTLIPVLLEISGRDSWLAVGAAIPPCLLMLAIAAWIAKRTEQARLLDWLDDRYGAVITWIVRLPLLVFVFLIGFVTTKDLTVWTNSSYLPQTPPTVILISLIIICFFCAWLGIRVIAVTAGILLPVVVVLGEFVMAANYTHKDYLLLFPIMEHGIQPLINGFIVTIGGIAELCLLLLLQHHVRTRITLHGVIWLGLLVALLTIGPVTGALAEFGPVEAAKQRFPAFEEWRLVKIGDYIEHLDFFSIYQWITGAFIRISLTLFVIGDMFTMKSKPRTILLLIVSAALVALNMLPLGDVSFIRLLKHYYFPGALVMVSLMMLLLLILVLSSKRRMGGNTN